MARCRSCCSRCFSWVVDLCMGWFGRAYYTESLASLCTMLVVWELLWLDGPYRVVGLRLACVERACWATVGAAMLVRTPFVLWFAILAPVVYLWRQKSGRQIAWGGIAGAAWQRTWSPHAWSASWWVAQREALAGAHALRHAKRHRVLCRLQRRGDGTSRRVVHRKAIFSARRCCRPGTGKAHGGCQPYLALAWVRTHLAQLPQLMAWKAYDLWFGKDNGQSLLLLVLASVGLLRTRGPWSATSAWPHWLSTRSWCR